VPHPSHREGGQTNAVGAASQAIRSLLQTLAAEAISQLWKAREFYFPEETIPEPFVPMQRGGPVSVMGGLDFS
jgi:hypothetical protein